MAKIRIIARIDVKNEYVIKGIHLEGLRKVGFPNEMALKYYNEGIDEIIFMDAVASLYNRNNIFHIIEKACKEVFIPITIGGGIRKISDIEYALKSGADKIAINTQAIKEPELIKTASRIYGSQCIIGSIEAKRVNGGWEAYIDNGREPTGVNAVEWAEKLQDLGAGELMITSIDQEGTKRGFDIDLINAIMKVTNIPIISSGGAGEIKHATDLLTKTNCMAFALASTLHYDLIDLPEMKQSLKNQNFNIRL